MKTPETLHARITRAIIKNNQSKTPKAPADLANDILNMLKDLRNDKIEIVNNYNDNKITRIEHALYLYYRVTFNDLRPRDKSEASAWPRHVAAYLLRVHAEFSLRRTGQILERSHGAISHSCAEVHKRLSVDDNFRIEVNELIKAI